MQQIVHALVANRAKITAEVAALPGAPAGDVLPTAEAVADNALRMAGRV